MGGMPWPGGTLLSTSLSTSSWSLTCRMRSCPQTRPCASSTFSCSRQSSTLRRSRSSRTVSRCWGGGTGHHWCHRVPCGHPTLCEMGTSLARWGGLGGSYLDMVLEIAVGLEEGLAVVLALVCRDVVGVRGWGHLGTGTGGLGELPSLTVDGFPTGAGEGAVFAPGWTDGQTDLYALQHWSPLPTQPLRGPQGGDTPTVLGTHRGGVLFRWLKGSPILLEVTRATRSGAGGWGPGLNVVPVSPPMCPHPLGAPPMPPGR